VWGEDVNGKNRAISLLLSYPVAEWAVNFGVWPFEGPRATLLDRHRIVLAEIYPRVCYALALDDELPAPLRIVEKTKAGPRADATRCLLGAPWLATIGATIDGADPDGIDEDDFDAMISAAGLLRCVLAGHPLERPGTGVVEGGILGVASLDLSRPATHGCRCDDPGAHRRHDASPRPPRKPTRAKGGGSCDHPCPLGCGHVFHGSRRGWDAHVAAVPNHPHWHPEICDGARRKAAFRAEFAHWFQLNGTIKGPSRSSGLGALAAMRLPSGLQATYRPP
jgi:hypothetical protein